MRFYQWFKGTVSQSHLFASQWTLSFATSQKCRGGWKAWMPYRVGALSGGWLLDICTIAAREISWMQLLDSPAHFYLWIAILWDHGAKVVEHRDKFDLLSIDGYWILVTSVPTCITLVFDQLTVRLILDVMALYQCSKDIRLIMDGAKRTVSSIYSRSLIQ